MDLTKVAQVMKEAAEEIKRLKQENAELKAQVQEMQKVAGDVGPSPIFGTINKNVGEYSDNSSFTFGNVSQDEYSQTPNSSVELFKQFFGGN